jgi:hypothetical protein
VSPVIAGARDRGRQVCVMMVAGVCNAGEPGAFEAREGEQEQARQNLRWKKDWNHFTV